MKIKTKKRIKAVFQFLAFAFVTAVFAFTLYLAVGTYGQVKYRQGFMNGYMKEKKPDIKTSTTLPSGDLEAISFAKSTNTGN